VYFATGKHDGAWNMAFDKLLMELIRAKKLDFVLRVYGWNPPLRLDRQAPDSHPRN